jgi:virulence factor Mce-like protein
VVTHPWAIFIAIGAVAFTWWVTGTRKQEHHVRAVFTTAPNLYKGLDVRVDGLDAGKVSKIENVDGKAIVTIGLKDDTFWPLKQGTTATLRFGSTIGNGTRIIDLNPAPRGTALPENGIIRNAQTVEATEFDDFFNAFDRKTRKALQGTLKGTADTFGDRSKQLGDGVDAAGPGLANVGNLASDLAADDKALRALVVNTDRVTRTLAARQGAVSDLVSVAAATFGAFARNTDGIRESLDRFAPALSESRTTLARLDGSVGHLDNLVGDLAPGARELGAMARELRPALAQLRDTVPGAVDAFRTGR